MRSGVKIAHGGNDGEREGHYILVLLEFFYFFVHMVRRYAMPILCQQGEEALLNELQPLLIDYAVKICFARFDEDYRRHVSERPTRGQAFLLFICMRVSRSIIQV